jgi:hypothetical protein
MKGVSWEEAKRRAREIVALGGTLDVVAHVGDWSVKVA